MRESPHVEDFVGPRVLPASPVFPGRHALREQAVVWGEFLAMGQTVVDSLEKSVRALRKGRIDLVAEVKELERDIGTQNVQSYRLDLAALLLVRAKICYYIDSAVD